MTTKKTETKEPKTKEPSSFVFKSLQKVRICAGFYQGQEGRVRGWMRDEDGRLMYKVYLYDVCLTLEVHELDITDLDSYKREAKSRARYQRKHRRNERIANILIPIAVIMVWVVMIIGIYSIVKFFTG